MLDYTKAIFNKTKKDVDTALTVFQFGSQILYIAYLIYILFTQSSIWYLYLSLLAISVAFFVFDIITTSDIKTLKEMGISIFGNKERKEKLSIAKRKRNNVRKIKFYVSHVLKLSVLVSSLLPIISTPYTVHPIHIIGATVMAILWIMQIVFEILRLVFDERCDLFIEAARADIEFVTKPVNSVKNAFKKLVGKEVEQPPAPSKERRYLDALVEKRKAEKAAEKTDEKASENADTECNSNEPKTKKEKLSEWLDSHVFGGGRQAKDTVEDVSFTVLSDDDTTADSE